MTNTLLVITIIYKWPHLSGQRNLVFNIQIGNISIPSLWSTLLYFTWVLLLKERQQLPPDTMMVIKALDTIAKALFIMLIVVSKG